MWDRLASLWVHQGSAGGHARAGHSEEPGQGAGRETEMGHPKATKLRWEDRKHSADFHPSSRHRLPRAHEGELALALLDPPGLTITADWVGGTHRAGAELARGGGAMCTWVNVTAMAMSFRAGAL